MIQTNVWGTITTLDAATGRAIVLWLMVSRAVALVLNFAAVIPPRWMARVKA